MGRFTIKQLLVSVALAAVGIALFVKFDRNASGLIPGLIWFGMWPAFGAAIYNLTGRPVRGAIIGLIVATVASFAISAFD